MIPDEILQLIFLNLPLRDITCVLQSNRTFKRIIDTNWFFYQYIKKHGLYYNIPESIKVTGEYILINPEYKTDYDYKKYTKIYHLNTNGEIHERPYDVFNLPNKPFPNIYIDNLEWFYLFKYSFILDYVLKTRIISPYNGISKTHKQALYGEYNAIKNYKVLCTACNSCGDLFHVYKENDLDMEDWRFIYEYRYKKLSSGNYGILGLMFDVNKLLKRNKITFRQICLLYAIYVDDQSLPDDIRNGTDEKDHHLKFITSCFAIMRN